MQRRKDDRICLPNKNKQKKTLTKSLPKASVCARNLLKKRKAYPITRRFLLQGSYTLEAVAVIPLTVVLWTFILFFFRVLQVESDVQEALYYAGRRMAAEAAAVEDDHALLLSGELLFRKELSRYPIVSAYVAGGGAGISLLSSSLETDYIRLRAEYRIRFPVGLLPFRGISVVQNGCCRKWTGKIIGEDGTKADGYLYYTDYGSVYHRSADCSYLNPSVQPTDIHMIALLRNREGHKYYPCGSCHADQISSGTVYYTNYGTSYHASTGCSGLKRSVHILPESEAAALPYCSKCGG